MALALEDKERIEDLAIKLVEHYGFKRPPIPVEKVLYEPPEGLAGVDISDLPAAGAAPEWMSEKAVSIGTYVISSGVFTVLGTVPPVLGSPVVTELLTQGANDVIGAVFAVEPDPFKAAKLMIDHIEEKRAALGI